jgi:hypothetical protein
VAEKKAFLLRISPELWADLSGWAADELRSVNGHIEYLLRQAVAERRAGRGPQRRSPPDRGDRGGSS